MTNHASSGKYEVARGLQSIAEDAYNLSESFRANRIFHTFNGPKMKKTTGWGVVRMTPWHLLGIFSTSAEARIRCLEAGPKYEVRFGEGNVEENDFSWIDSSMK